MAGGPTPLHVHALRSSWAEEEKGKKNAGENKGAQKDDKKQHIFLSSGYEEVRTTVMRQSATPELNSGRRPLVLASSACPLSGRRAGLHQQGVGYRSV